MKAMMIPLAMLIRPFFYVAHVFLLCYDVRTDADRSFVVMKSVGLPVASIVALF